MANKDLKKLNRKELLEMLLMQAEEIERLERELVTVKRELDNREIVMQKTGSIAEASLQLSGIFSAAEEAARLYVKSIEKKAIQAEDSALHSVTELQRKSYAIISEANLYSMRKHKEADAYYEEIKRKAKKLEKE